MLSRHRLGDPLVFGSLELTFIEKRFFGRGPIAIRGRAVFPSVTKIHSLDRERGSGSTPLAYGRREV